MEIFENLTLKIADNLRYADSHGFLGLLMKFLSFVFFKKMPDDCEVAALENNRKRNSPLLFANKKSVLSISLLGSNNANEDDNSRISCGHSQKTVSSFKGRGIINLTYINLNYIHSVILTKDAISIHNANSKDCVEVKSSQVNMKKKIFSKKIMFPALAALTLLAACSNADVGNQEENQTCLNSSSIVRNSSSDKPFSSSKTVVPSSSVTEISSSSKTPFDDIKFWVGEGSTKAMAKIANRLLTKILKNRNLHSLLHTPFSYNLKEP